MNTATLAVAGARKTQSIIEECSSGDPQKRRLILTFTQSGQIDLERRLKASCPAGAVPDVLGWYSFLLRHWVRPFLPLMYPGRRLKGFNFEGEPRRDRFGNVIASGASRFFDGDSRAYKLFLSKLAIDVAAAAEGTVITRLQRMYDEIYVDEVQDLTGYDLDVLELLLRSTSTIRLVGDIRQSVFDTNPRDPRYKKFRGINMLDWFKEQEDAGCLTIKHSSDTWRSNQEIASFSDLMFDPELKFPPTVSKQTAISDHDGVFAISIDQVHDYIATYNPVCLRQAITTKVPDGIDAVNFGISKGLTHERVLIFTTGPMKQFLTNGAPLAPKTACGLYVGVTRAVHSVAFVVDQPAKTSLVVWSKNP